MARRTVYEVIRQAYSEQPHLQFATTPKEDVIGAWSEAQQRYVPVAALAITGEWVSMPYELLVNGQHINREWRPVAK